MKKIVVWYISGGIAFMSLSARGDVPLYKEEAVSETADALETPEETGCNAKDILDQNICCKFDTVRDAVTPGALEKGIRDKKCVNCGRMTCASYAAAGDIRSACYTKKCIQN